MVSLQVYNVMTKESVTRVKFVSTVSKMGEKRIIIIPKNYHDELDKLNPKQVKITIDDEIWVNYLLLISQKYLLPFSPRTDGRLSCPLTMHNSSHHFNFFIVY
jgi:hypothetical protein